MNIFKGFFQAQQGSGAGTNEMKRQELLRQEIVVARGIFGPQKAGLVRDFFCVDRHSWVWYEESTDSSGHVKRMTTRFDVRDGQVLKSQNGGDYTVLSGQELKNFKDSVAAYLSVVKKSIYTHELR